MSPMTTLALGRSVTHDADGGGGIRASWKRAGKPKWTPKTTHTNTHTQRHTHTNTRREVERWRGREKESKSVYRGRTGHTRVPLSLSLSRCQHIRNEMDSDSRPGPENCIFRKSISTFGKSRGGGGTPRVSPRSSGLRVCVTLLRVCVSLLRYMGNAFTACILSNTLLSLSIAHTHAQRNAPLPQLQPPFRTTRQPQAPLERGLLQTYRVDPSSFQYVIPSVRCGTRS